MHAQEARIVCNLSAETSSSFTPFRFKSSKNDVHNLRDLPDAWTGVRGQGSVLREGPYCSDVVSAVTVQFGWNTHLGCRFGFHETTTDVYVLFILSVPN
jgi:hypothetical protein